MKAEATVPSKNQPIVIWERKTEQAGQVIPFSASRDRRGQVEQEAVVSRWEIGPTNNPAVVTQVSSGFRRVPTPNSSPQAVYGQMAA